MKITGVEPIPLRYNVPGSAYGGARGQTSRRETCLVRVTTDEGLIGLGEAFGPAAVIASHVEELGPFFDGEDPFDREKIWNAVVSRRYHWGRGGLHIAALSGLEMACWDLMGKACGMPAAKLLGGWHRDSVRPYASTGYFTDSNDEFRASIEAALGEGFDHLKIKCGRGLKDDLHRIRTVEDASREHPGLMVDLNGNYTADTALRLADEVGDRLVWLEEPVPPDDLDGYRRIRDGSTVAIASGEANALRLGFRDLISERLVDVVQPDVSNCGGLGEAKAIVQLAHTWNLRFSPHVWGGAVMFAASLQLCAATAAHPQESSDDAELLFEYDQATNGLLADLLQTSISVEPSAIEIPTGPGLGIDLDWAAVDHYRLDQKA